MKIDTIETGMICENCYIVSDDAGIAAVVDPGDESEKILRFLEQNKLECQWILITHGHFDHIGAVADVKQATGARVCIHTADAPQLHFAPDLLCKEGDEIVVGDITFSVIETPGHTKGGVCYIAGDALFSGDTLFCESIGRTDLAGGDFTVMQQTLRKLRELPYDDLRVFAGHMQPSTLAHERAHNPFMGRLDARQ